MCLLEQIFYRRITSLRRCVSRMSTLIWTTSITTVIISVLDVSYFSCHSCLYYSVADSLSSVSAFSFYFAKLHNEMTFSNIGICNKYEPTLFWYEAIHCELFGKIHQSTLRCALFFRGHIFRKHVHDFLYQQNKCVKPSQEEYHIVPIFFRTIRSLL